MEFIITRVPQDPPPPPPDRFQLEMDAEAAAWLLGFMGNLMSPTSQTSAIYEALVVHRARLPRESRSVGTKAAGRYRITARKTETHRYETKS